MELYHASKKTFKSGDVISGGNFSTFYLAASKEMDAKKPGEVPARSTALYCSDSKEFAVYFLKMQKVPEEEINLYTVRVDSFHKAPFSITHLVEQNLKNGGSVKALIEEYWHPTKQWYYYEYLVPEFEVIEMIEKPELSEIILSHRSGKDHELAKSIS